MNRKPLVTVYSASGQLAAESIRLFLNAQGIAAELSQESAGQAIGLTVGRLGEVKILVPEDQVTKARRLIRAMEAGEFSDTRFEEGSDLPVDEEGSEEDLL